jgi:hypothetical protein
LTDAEIPGSFQYGAQIIFLDRTSKYGASKATFVSRLDENIVLYNVFHRLKDAKPVDAAWGAPGCGDPLYSADRNTAGYPEGCPALAVGNPMKNPMKSP